MSDYKQTPPTVGRIVHAFMQGRTYAALVSAVQNDDGLLTLHIFDGDTPAYPMIVKRNVEPAYPNPNAGEWRWAWPKLVHLEGTT